MTTEHEGMVVDILELAITGFAEGDYSKTEKARAAIATLVEALEDQRDFLRCVASGDAMVMASTFEEKAIEIDNALASVKQPGGV